MKALILGWRNEKTENQLITTEQICEEVKYVFEQGWFGKTTILVHCAKENLKKCLQIYLKDTCGLDKFYICNALEFYEKDKVIQKNCLTVETPQGVQGLESTVVIYITAPVTARWKQIAQLSDKLPENMTPLQQWAVENPEEYSIFTICILFVFLLQ